MWLLSTATAEIHYFHSPERVPGGYAILSHVWDEDGEMSFQEVQALPATVRGTGAVPRHLAGAKIRNACMLAESHGQQWLWIDTCCIDKTSSSELSEAINSMFRYYSLSVVCYAYLKDVPGDHDLNGAFSPFWTSRWYKRGWTLQELLAPRFLVFLSKDWDVLGTKADFARQLEQVVRIPAAVLRFEQPLAQVSIARRMSWAAGRETTRQEDEAYCLLGIFGINIPTLYGEGRQAFRRLQEAIMQQYSDTTLFAWQPLRTRLRSLVSDPLTAALEKVESIEGKHSHNSDSFLFAPSPHNFVDADDIEFMAAGMGAADTQVSSSSIVYSSEDHVQQLRGIATFLVTPHGVLARIPIYESAGYAIAVMPWYSAWFKSPLGLLLTPCPYSADPLRPLYCVNQYTRIIPLLFERRDHWPIRHQWKEVYLAHRPPPGVEMSATTSIPIDLPIRTPFRLWHLSNFLRDLTDKSGCLLKSVDLPPMPWTGVPALAFNFTSPEPEVNTESRYKFTISLGRCAAHSGRGHPMALNGHGEHWANIRFAPLRDDDSTSGDINSSTSASAMHCVEASAPSHRCPDDHISQWPLRTRVFEMTLKTQTGQEAYARARYSGFRLSFTSCPLNPADTLVLHIFPRTRRELLYEAPDEVFREIDHVQAVCESEDVAPFVREQGREPLVEIMEDLRMRLTDLALSIAQDAELS